MLIQSRVDQDLQIRIVMMKIVIALHLLDQNSYVVRCWNEHYYDGDGNLTRHLRK